jgi:hypothetical protein
MKIVLKQFKDIDDDSKEVFFLLERHFLKVENNILMFFNYPLDLVQGLGNLSKKSFHANLLYYVKGTSTNKAKHINK